MIGVPALTLHQPWASLIAVGAKTIETRSWPAPEALIGGRLLIHAGKGRPPIPEWRAMAHAQGMGDVEWMDWIDTLPLGAVVASCVLEACIPIVAIDGVRFEPVEPSVTVNDRLLIRWSRDGRNRIHSDDIEDQRPFGHYEPGRFAWVLRDVKPTSERCPRCWNDGWIEYENGEHDRCPNCETPFGPPGCPPVPMRGRQRLWTPTTEDWERAA